MRIKLIKQMLRLEVLKRKFKKKINKDKDTQKKLILPKKIIFN